MDAPTAAFDGVFLTRLAILRLRHAADPATQAAIDKALADPDFVADAAMLVTTQFAASGKSGGGVAAFLALLFQYLPQILALITTIFGA